MHRKRPKESVLPIFLGTLYLRCNDDLSLIRPFSDFWCPTSPKLDAFVSEKRDWNANSSFVPPLTTKYDHDCVAVL